MVLHWYYKIRAGEYPEQIKQRVEKQNLSPLYLADETVLISIMEMISGLFLSKDIVYQNGKPVYLVDLSKGFEWLFNINFLIELSKNTVISSNL